METRVVRRTPDPKNFETEKDVCTREILRQVLETHHRQGNKDGLLIDSIMLRAGAIAEKHNQTITRQRINSILSTSATKPKGEFERDGPSHSGKYRLREWQKLVNQQPEQRQTAIITRPHQQLPSQSPPPPLSVQYQPQRPQQQQQQQQQQKPSLAEFNAQLSNVLQHAPVIKPPPTAIPEQFRASGSQFPSIPPPPPPPALVPPREKQDDEESYPELPS